MRHVGGMCLNWKVAAALAVVGLGVWAVAPNVVGAVVPLLLIALCPLSMLLMMRGMGNMGGSRADAPAETGQPEWQRGTRDEQLEELKLRHAALAREIESLEAVSASNREQVSPTAASAGMSLN